MRLNQLQEKLRSNVSEATKVEMDLVNKKKKIAKIVNNKTQGPMRCSEAQQYKFGEKNNKYFYNLEKRNHKKKHVTSLTKEDGNIVLEPKQILEEEERFFREIYESKNVCPESANLELFFDGLNTLKQEEVDTCEGLLTLEEHTKSLKQFMNNKTPGSDGFTIEFHCFFWNTIGPIMVDSFNYAFENGQMSISQKRSIISLIPKKDKDKKYLRNWRPISLLTMTTKLLQRL